jgi:hypothetical protein
MRVEPSTRMNVATFWAHCRPQIKVSDQAINQACELLIEADEEIERLKARVAELEQVKVFHWTNVLCDYTPGMMVAVAHNVDEARAALAKCGEPIPDEDLATEPKVYDMTEARGFASWGGG